jgi:phosphohistidine phosphatase SixA
MTIVLVRHGARLRESDPERDEFREIGQPLNSQGELESQCLATRLGGKYHFSILLTSPFAHSRQTASILKAGGNTSAPPVLELFSLSPHYPGPRHYREWPRVWTGLSILETIGKEARYAGHELAGLDTVTLVLHQPRLQQLAAGITSRQETEFSNIGFSEAVCLRGDSFTAFLEGQGEEIERISGRAPG